MPSITNQEDGFSVRTKLNKILGLHTSLQSGDYTLTADDHARMIAVDSLVAATVTVPAGLPSDFVCTISQIGVGSVTVEGSGATVNAFEDNRTLAGQYAAASLYCLGVDTHLLVLSSAVAAEPVPPIDATMTTTAGVFDSSGLLVRVLWTSEDGHVGEPTWDGELEDGSVAPTGDYTLKMIGHDVSYLWEGAIGNSSPNHNTVSYHAYGSVVRDLATTDAGEAYFSTAYDERIQTFRVMDLDDIQNSVSAIPPQVFRQAIIAAHTICTDGTIAYLGITAGAAENGVIGTDCTTKIKVPFSSGTVVGSLTYLGLNTDPAFAGLVTGMAVQKTGSFIFLARPLLPGIQVYNKSTAAFVSTFASLEHPRRLASNPSTITELWVANDADGDGLSEEVVKCAVDGAGTITATATTISCQDALALAVSPDGSTLLLADGGTDQRVKAYNTADGSVRSGWGTGGALGTLGGYIDSPAVTNTKFMFRSQPDMGSGDAQTFLAYQSDGRFWVGDIGNCRYLRFSSGEAPAFVDNFMYLPGFYPCRVCKNDSTRVFMKFLEFSIDYSLPLSPTNGSWTLVNNWYGNIVDQFPDPTVMAGTAGYNCLKFVGTYSNGRTYAQLDLIGIAARRWFELTSTGLRDTGHNILPDAYIDDVMDAYYINNASPGDTCILTRNPFTGFDGSGNPTWENSDGTPGNDTALGGTETVLTSEVLPALFPRTHATDNNMIQGIEPLANGVIPIFDPDTFTDDGPTNNHFGGIHGTSGAVKFNTHPTTPAKNGGGGRLLLLYPPAPYITRGFGFGGGPALYIPGHEYVFTVFNGEEWGNNQTNIITHWHESGLALSTFGPVAPYFAAESLRSPDLLTGDDIPAHSPYSFLGQSGMAGNCRWGGIAFENDKYYIYQNDEWYHGGITRWRVSGLDSVIVEDYPIVWDSSTYTPPSDPTDMLAGLDLDTILIDGTGGWHRDQAENVDPQFTAYSGAVSCDPRHPDIVLEAAFWNDSVLRGINRALTRSGSGDWVLEGEVEMYPGFSLEADPDTSSGLMYFDVLDSADNIILRWYCFTRSDAHAGTVRANGEDVFPMTEDPQRFTLAYVGALREFSIQADVSAETMLFRYDIHEITVPVFEVAADIGDPASMRIVFDSKLPGSPKMCLTRLRFE